MTEKDFPEQVADLLVQAFQNLGHGLTHEPGDGREDFLAEAQLQVHAAQALATLAAAREARVQALIQLAALESVGGEAPDPAIAREAYSSAALALGLAEDEADHSGAIDALIAAGFLEAVGDDAKDAELGDLP